LPPNKCTKNAQDTLPGFEFNEVYLMLSKCDLDLKKLLKSSKNLEEV
jgi:hypothetical protein